jgi:hypothetical protein
MYHILVLFFDKNVKFFGDNVSCPTLIRADVIVNVWKLAFYQEEVVL